MWDDSIFDQDGFVRDDYYYSYRDPVEQNRKEEEYKKAEEVERVIVAACPEEEINQILLQYFAAIGGIDLNSVNISRVYPNGYRAELSITGECIKDGSENIFSVYMADGSTQVQFLEKKSTNYKDFSDDEYYRTSSDQKIEDYEFKHSSSNTILVDKKVGIRTSWDKESIDGGGIAGSYDTYDPQKSMELDVKITFLDDLVDFRNINKVKI